MSKKRSVRRPEDIVAKLRQVDALAGQGTSVADAVRRIGVTDVVTRRTSERRDLLHSERSRDSH